MRSALEVTTALRSALSMEGLYPPATSVPSPTFTPSFFASFTLAT